MNDSFIKCVADICGLELTNLVGNYKCSLFGSGVAVVEGHNGVTSYCTESICFALPKGKLTVDGQNLKIKCLQKHYAVVCGNIVNVAVKDAK